jgi:hypothetical protein
MPKPSEKQPRLGKRLPIASAALSGPAAIISITGGFLLDLLASSQSRLGYERRCRMGGGRM